MANNNLPGNQFVEFAGTPVVQFTGGDVGAKRSPPFTTSLTQNPNNSVGNTGLTDRLLITFTNGYDGNPADFTPSLTPFNLAIVFISYKVGGVDRLRSGRG